MAQTLEARDIQKLIDQVTRDGYVVIPHAFSASQVSQAKAELGRLSGTAEAGPAGQAGRNAFEGLRTQRIYALLNKARCFDQFALHPAVLALNDHFLDEGYLLNALHSVNIGPGEAAQRLHHDDQYVTVPRPHRPFGAPWTTTPRPTAAPGASVVPRSHTWAGDRVPARSEAVAVAMPAGSIVYFVGTLWHGGGRNASGAGRLALTVQYCQPWMRPLENQLLAVDWDKLDDVPPRLVGMMGYKVGAPFIGYVDGRSPRTRVTELLRRWRGRNKL
ncbi:phytanoyl-CoA dioxygenase family protein [Metarhizium robertsii ARSEF 23]|uniref:Phytanoyl-CoA dioxygenase family protein n=1 Tax=Metarhizium robertsii (strain ARSEF 23 / ATCC MYA-3075) TaxID=655844 RepID=E9EN38_METRA|nr:phytanoyl-CoA dioxygenase family protein [Metarhizium robertsii ARSEF 23]EFZ04102.1 phytanoyl-CoA dioxygenase family protein [Metarhizium robertsii ARSEF 23]